ncbi:MAG: tyrosine-type recombinase/integrase [Sphingobacteriales bacterium]
MRHTANDYTAKGAAISVRKRTWFTRAQLKDIEPEAKRLATVAGKAEWKEYFDHAARSLGIEPNEAWIVDYIDQKGGRHIQTFGRKKDADEFQATVKVEVRQGVHTPQNKSLTVAEAAEDWIKYVQLEKRERSTIEHYRFHVKNHINPRIGREKLSKLTTPRIQAFRDELLENLSRAQAKKVLVSLKSLLRDARRRGNVAQNVALDVSISTDKRAKMKLKVGVDIPTPDEIKRILHAATGRIRPFLITAIFTGLRSSELRGLQWADVDLKKAELHVRQRADRYSKIGKPKSESGNRTIPLGPLVVNTLKEWRLACPKGALDLVFPNTLGKLWDHADIVSRYMWPTMVAARVVDAKREAKYTGLHALRHFYASWLINRKKDGGLELPIKTVQQRLGHSSIVMTSDVYGHLFPRGDDGSEMAEAERLLLACDTNATYGRIAQ